MTPQVLEALRPRFDAIDPWRIATADDGVDIEWDQPPALADLGFRVGLEFIVETASGDLDPDDGMLDLWQRFYDGRHRHAVHFREHLVALYRDYQPYLIEQDRFPADLSDEEIKRTVRGTMTIRRQEYQGETTYYLDASFAVRWDGEHGYQFEYDEETGEFGELC